MDLFPERVPYYTLGLPPTQDSSHHQDYEPFLVGNPNLNLHLPLESWGPGGPDPWVFHSKKTEVKVLKYLRRVLTEAQVPKGSLVKLGSIETNGFSGLCHVRFN